MICEIIYTILLLYISIVDSSKAKVAILGASGYTGAELMRLLTIHPQVEIKVLTSTERNAGKDFASIFPQFAIVRIFHA